MVSGGKWSIVTWNDVNVLREKREGFLVVLHCKLRKRIHGLPYFLKHI